MAGGTLKQVADRYHGQVSPIATGTLLLERAGGEPAWCTVGPLPSGGGGGASIRTPIDDYDAAGDGVTDDAASFDAVLTEGTCVVASDAIIDRCLWVFQGATIKVTNGAAITFTELAHIVAGDYQIFGCAVPSVPGPIVFSLSPGDASRPIGMTGLERGVSAAWFPGETTAPTGGGAKRDMGNILNTAIHAGCRDIHLPGGRSWNLFTTVRIVSDPRIKGGRGGVAVSWLVELDVNNIM